MEPSFTRYIWKHTSRQQLWILCVVLASMIPYYLAFDLPKMLINGPITGTGFESPDATQAFLPGTWIAGLELNRMQTLLGLSIAFLALVIINGLFKYYINTYKGLLGERLLRRIRFELIDRILRFLPGEFKRVKGAEISSMVKDEVEPLGGFTAEAFVQPVLLGGQALTALGFIFMQHFWLGVVALFMASVQMLVIPKLRQRLLVLGRERQIGARQLAGRVTEIVEGIETIHANDTSNYERADVATRLGNLFRIRYEIYSRKFKIKFLNNFLAQVTPFLFYLIGGYLAISGRLDVGQLVAVITAYKELPGPLKQLIDWDMAKQDVQVKYEQIVDQFDAEQMIHPDVQAITASANAQLSKPLSASNITMEDEGGSATLEHVSLTIDAGQSVAVVGDSYSGANILAEAFGGITRPVKGKITAGKDNLIDLPESVTGQRISYASSDTYFFSGSLEDNLLYGLKHQPLDKVTYMGTAATMREWELVEAKRTGNPDFDLNSNWIDTNAVSGLTESEALVDAMRQVLSVAQLSDDVFDFALHSKIEAQTDNDLASQIVTLRKAARTELQQKGLSELIIPFDVDSYNSQATVLENIFFGILTDTSINDRHEGGTQYFRNTLKQTGLDEQLFKMGLAIAKSAREIFQDLPEDHPFFDRLEFMDAREIPQFRVLYQRTKDVNFDEISTDDRYAWIKLSFKYCEPQYRFGLLDDTLMQKIINTRKLLHENMPAELKAVIDMYDPENFLPSANLLDNIVFGKVDLRFKDVNQQLREVFRPLLDKQPGLYSKMYSVGLNYNVGPAGRRLTLAQRQKLNFARALMRKSDYYVFNRPVSGLDQSQQAQIIVNTLNFFSKQGDNPGVVWVLASEPNTKYFQRRITFKNKAVIEDKILDPVTAMLGSVTSDTVR
jgi:putative ABC transport system ATP-binding protein